MEFVSHRSVQTHCNRRRISSPRYIKVKTYYVVKNYHCGHFEHDVIQLRDHGAFIVIKVISYIFLWLSRDGFFSSFFSSTARASRIHYFHHTPHEYGLTFTCKCILIFFPTISTCGNCPVNYVRRITIFTATRILT